MKSRKALAVKAGPLFVLMEAGVLIIEKHCGRTVTAVLVILAVEGIAQMKPEKVSMTTNNNLKGGSLQCVKSACHNSFACKPLELVPWGLVVK